MALPLLISITSGTSLELSTMRAVCSICWKVFSSNSTVTSGCAAWKSARASFQAMSMPLPFSYHQTRKVRPPSAGAAASPSVAGAAASPPAAGAASLAGAWAAGAPHAPSASTSSSASKVVAIRLFLVVIFDSPCGSGVRTELGSGWECLWRLWESPRQSKQLVTSRCCRWEGAGGGMGVPVEHEPVRRGRAHDSRGGVGVRREELAR